MSDNYTENAEKLPYLEKLVAKLQKNVRSSLKNQKNLEKKIAQQESQISELATLNDQFQDEIRKTSQVCHNANTVSKFLKKVVKKRGNKIKHVEKRIADIHKSKNDCNEKQNAILKEHLHIQFRKNIEKNHYLAIFAVMVVVAAFVVYQGNAIGITNTQNQIADPSSIKSGYVIENLRGDTIDTWMAWHLINDETLYVNIVNANDYPPETIAAIKNAITSIESIQINDSLLHKGPKDSMSTYHLGWVSAVSSVSHIDTKFFIPQEFKVLEDPAGQGDITILLTDMIHGDGYSGFTKSIADESRHQILKSQITIYDADNISDEQVEIIVRHEFGHALGLAHSTDPDDLMHATIATSYPYISECDVQALVSLYDDTGQSHVCKK